MPYAVCALALGLRWVVGNFGKKATGKAGKTVTGFVKLGLLAIFSMTLANTGIGVWISNLIRTVAGWGTDLFASVTGVSISVSLIASIVFALVALAGIGNLIDGEPDGIVKTAVVLLPFLALAATGPLVDSSAGLFEAVSNAGGNALTNLIGR